jgi:hypothetical protein
LIAQEFAGKCESERQELKRKYIQLEEQYKRDSELFRNEAMKRDSEVEEQKGRTEGELQRARQGAEQGVEFVVSIRKDLMKLMKQMEKKHEAIQIEEDTKSSNQTSAATLNGKKLLFSSMTETFNRSVDNLVKRIESHLYFSQMREPVSDAKLNNYKTAGTLEPSSAMKRQISALIATSSNKRGGADLISTLSSHFNRENADPYQQ